MKAYLIKVGGELFESPEKRKSLIAQLAQLQREDVPVTLVHGGGPQITQMAESLGIAPQFVNGHRVTDEETMKVVRAVLLGSINAPFVAELNAAGVPAVGLHGGDAGLIQVVRDAPELGYVGKITAVRTEILHALVSRNIMPVVAPLGVDEEGALYNINADIAAGKLAGALGVLKFIAVTNVKGLYREYGKEESFVSTISFSEIEHLCRSGGISAGMLPKLEGVLVALREGAKEAQIVDGRETGTLLSQIQSMPPQGTIVYRSAA